jgi:Spy/CpxP family protein refolding chaperone
MRYLVFAAAAGLCFCTAAYADDPTASPAVTAQTAPTPAPAPAPAPAPPLPTHVDTTVVGSGVSDQPAGTPAPNLDNNHDFVAGAPELLKITNQLHLSSKQQSQLHDIIEKSDAGAGVLIGRDHDVRQMIAATTPADPQYAKLIADQSAAAALWTENRENLQRDVLAILTPVQQKRFLELQSRATSGEHAAE